MVKSSNDYGAKSSGSGLGMGSGLAASNLGKSGLGGLCGKKAWAKVLRGEQSNPLAGEVMAGKSAKPAREVCPNGLRQF